MDGQIIPIEAIHAAAIEAAKEGMTECPEKFKDFPAVWSYELRVAQYHQEKLRKQLSTLSIVREMTEVGFDVGQG